MKKAKKRYPLNIDPDLFEEFKGYVEKEFKLVNVKLVELVLSYVQKERGKK